MAPVTKIAVIAALLAVIIGSAGVSYAYAYSSAVTVGAEVSGSYISIDIHNGDATIATSVSFNVDDATISMGGSRVVITPTSDYILRISSDAAKTVSLLGAFYLNGSSAAGSAVKSVTFVLTDSNETDHTMLLAGGHPGAGETQTPDVLEWTLAAFDDYYSCGLVVKQIEIDLVAEVEESSDGKAYVTVSGSSGEEVAISDLVDPNALCYSFITYEA